MSSMNSTSSLTANQAYEVEGSQVTAAQHRYRVDHPQYTVLHRITPCVLSSACNVIDVMISSYRSRKQLNAMETIQKVVKGRKDSNQLHYSEEYSFYSPKNL